MENSPVAEALVTLSRFFVVEGSFEDTLTRVAEIAVRAFPGADMAGITRVVDGRPCTAAFTDGTAPEIDKTQYRTGAGPGLAAFEEGRVTEIPSTREPGPWPEFRRVAAAHGVGSTLSVPLLVEGSAVGALNLYARSEHGFPDEHKGEAEQFGARAAVVLANDQAYREAKQLSVGLAEAMKSRAVIEQAKGILMATGGVDPDEAFDMLTRASQRENVKLRDIARRIVEETCRVNATAGRQR